MDESQTLVLVPIHEARCSEQKPADYSTLCECSYKKNDIADFPDVIAHASEWEAHRLELRDNNHVGIDYARSELLPAVQTFTDDVQSLDLADVPLSYPITGCLQVGDEVHESDVENKVFDVERVAC